MAIQVFLPTSLTPGFPALCISCERKDKLAAFSFFVDRRMMKLTKGKGRELSFQIPVCPECRGKIEAAIKFDYFLTKLLIGVSLGAAALSAVALYFALAGTDTRSNVAMSVACLSVLAGIGIGLLARMVIPAPDPLPFAIYRVVLVHMEVLCCIFHMEEFGRQFRTINQDDLMSVKKELIPFDGDVRPTKRFRLSTLIMATFAAGFCIWADTEIYDTLQIESRGGNIALFFLIAWCEVFLLILLMNFKETGRFTSRRR